jgi:non-specific serine/threonine protein kinase
MARGDWLERLASDEANFRAAVRWCVEAGEAGSALRFVADLWRFWQADGRLAEGRALATRVLEMPGAEAPTITRMWALGAAGSLAYWQADMAATRALYRAQVELARMLEDDRGIADALFNLAHVDLLDAGDETAGRRSLEEARRRYRVLGDEVGAARTEWGLGNVALEDGDIESALAIFRASRDRFVALGDPQYTHMAAASLAWAEFRAGDQAAAARWALIGLREAYETHDLATATISLHIGVLVAMMFGRPEVAARLTGAFDSGCERYGVRPPAGLERFLKVTDPFGMARQALSPAAWDLAYGAGRRMTLGEAVDLATSMAPPDVPPAT